MPAEVLSRTILESTDGPIEHIETLCPLGHGFWFPAFLLERPERDSGSDRAVA
jgi:hypothetical protein